MVYPYYCARRSFYGNPVLGCPRQYHTTDENPICSGIHDCLYTNCRMDSVFWQPDDFLMAKAVRFNWNSDKRINHINIA